MKIKSIIFAALVAGMSFAANAEDGTAYTNSGDVLSAENVSINAGESTVLNLVLNRSTSPDFTNIQFDMIFPEGIVPSIDKDWEVCGWEGEGIPTKAKKPVVAYQDNMMNADQTEVVPMRKPDDCAYECYRVVGVNMSKTAVTANPCQIYCVSIAATDECPTGDYKLVSRYMKYTCFNNDSYATSELGKEKDMVICTIHVDNPTTGVNDLKVNSAKTYKTIENGQVIIVKGDVRYNTMGQIVK